MVPPLLINEQSFDLAKSLIAEYNEKDDKWGYDRIAYNEETRELYDPGYPFSRGGFLSGMKESKIQQLYMEISRLCESRLINVPYFRPLLEDLISLMEFSCHMCSILPITRLIRKSFIWVGIPMVGFRSMT